MNIFLKAVFLSLLFYLFFQPLSVNFDKKLKKVLGVNTGLNVRKGVSLLGQKFAKYFNHQETEQKLKQAGRPWGLSADGFIGMKIILPLTMAAIQTYLRSNLYYLIIVSLLCFFLPDILIILITNDRKKEIKKELPDVVDIFESTVVSGIDVGTSFNLAAEYVNGKELKKELSLLAAKYAVTKDKDQALLDFRNNINMYDTDLLVLALMQDNKTGRAQDMLESLAHAQANNMIAMVEKNAKAVEYRVLMVCSLMAVSTALMIFYPYFLILDSGMSNIFK